MILRVVPLACSVPSHHHIATANFFRLFRQEMFISHLVFHPRASMKPIWYPVSQPWSLTHQFCLSHNLRRDTSASLESQHNPDIRTLQPFWGDKIHAANQFLASCMGWDQPCYNLTGVGWLHLGDYSPGHVFSRIRYLLLNRCIVLLGRYH